MIDDESIGLMFCVAVAAISGIAGEAATNIELDCNLILSASCVASLCFKRSLYRKRKRCFKCGF